MLLSPLLLVLACISEEYKPCVPGFELGRTYSLTVQRRFDEGLSLLNPDSVEGGTCGSLEGVVPGARAELRLENISPPGYGCGKYGARLTKLDGVDIVAEDPSFPIVYLNQRILVGGNFARMTTADGCTGMMRVEFGVPDARDPFELLPDKSQRRVVLVRDFRPFGSAARCQRPGSTLLASPEKACLDVFEVSLSR